METRMRHLGTPQHPSSQSNPSYWGSSPHEFRTPQHPSTLGSISSHWPEAGFSTPQQHKGIGKNYWGTLDGKRQFGTPVRQFGGTPKTALLGVSQTSLGMSQTRGLNQWGTPERVRQFGTPQHPASFREFRTPQHPSQGTNSWGGASPMLARNIPQESLDLRYEMLYRNDQAQSGVIFTAPAEDEEEDDHYHGFSPYKYEPAFTPNPYPNPNPNPNVNSTRGRRRGLLWKLIKSQPREEDSRVQAKQKRTWFPRLRMQKRWPTGW